MIVKRDTLSLKIYGEMSEHNDHLLQSPIHMKSRERIGICNLPRDVFYEGIIEYLLPCNLQQLDTAFTNRLERPLLRNLWKSYHYSTPAKHVLSFVELKWLISVGICIVGANLPHNSNYEALHCPVSFAALNAPNLKRLDMTQSVLCLSDDLLVQIAHGCPGLEELRITCGKFVSDVGIIALAQHCPNLKTLNFYRFYRMTNATILSLCKHCPLIQHITLQYAARLSSIAVDAIAIAYPKLQTLSIPYCLENTIQSVCSLATHCHELKKVVLSCNENINAAMTALWAANLNLIDIDLKYDKYIKDDDIICLAQ